MPNNSESQLSILDLPCSPAASHRKVLPLTSAPYGLNRTNNAHSTPGNSIIAVILIPAAPARPADLIGRSEDELVCSLSRCHRPGRLRPDDGLVVGWLGPPAGNAHCPRDERSETDFVVGFVDSGRRKHSADCRYMSRVDVCCEDVLLSIADDRNERAVKQSGRSSVKINCD